DAAAVAKDVAAALGAPWFALSERHLTYRVMGREGHIDVAAVRGGGIHDDLGERDFTVNAMALPIRAGRAEGGPAGAAPSGPVDREALIDPFGGLGHLQERRLVAVSDRVFSDDPLRLMRAARFCHVLGFEIDDDLGGSIRSHAPELARTAMERVAAEMVLTLAEDGSAEAVRLWRDLGLLGVVLPEVADPGGLDATLVVLERLDDVLGRPLVWFPATADILGRSLERPVDGGMARPVALRLAGLLHRLAEAEAEGVGRRLKLSGDMISLLRTVSRCFSEPPGRRSGLEERTPAFPEARMLSRAEVLFLWGAAPFEPEVILLAAAAGAESVLPGPAGRMMALWAERSARGIARPPVDGEALMSELGLEGGPLVGKALREVRLAWETGERTTIAGLLAVARDALGME
ncbi:MAG: CCA tRNA nucleotidyltransferase, partial [Thermoleophilia bacterium]|nr:CCA tRNA nucleotidyltransferase [Thermoleophilia bacterium]